MNCATISQKMNKAKKNCRLPYCAKEQMQADTKLKGLAVQFLEHLTYCFLTVCSASLLYQITEHSFACSTQGNFHQIYTKCVSSLVVCRST